MCKTTISLEDRKTRRKQSYFLKYVLFYKEEANEKKKDSENFSKWPRTIAFSLGYGKIETNFMMLEVALC